MRMSRSITPETHMANLDVIYPENASSRVQIFPELQIRRHFEQGVVLGPAVAEAALVLQLVRRCALDRHVVSLQRFKRHSLGL